MTVTREALAYHARSRALIVVGDFLVYIAAMNDRRAAALDRLSASDPSTSDPAADRPLAEAAATSTATSASTEPTSSRERLARALGLHPLVAFGMIAADWMMFGGEAGSGGVGIAITIPVAIALTIPCILIQRFSFGDAWGGAIGKGLMVGVLTAIPMPLGSPLTLAGGVMGLLGGSRKKAPAALPAKGASK